MGWLEVLAIDDHACRHQSSQSTIVDRAILLNIPQEPLHQAPS